MKGKVTMSQICDARNGIVEPTYAQFKKWSNVSIPVKVVQQGNARENKNNNFKVTKKHGSLTCRVNTQLNTYLNNIITF